MSSTRSKPHGVARRHRPRTLSAALAALVVVGALSGTFVTSAESASRDEEEHAQELEGERALDVARERVRDQVETPTDAGAPLAPGEIASPREVARDVSPRLRTIPPRPPQARGRDDEAEYRPPKAEGTGGDPVAQTGFADRATLKTITQTTSIAGPGLENMSVSVAPPDPNSAVGPNHIITITNLQYAVYSKTGSTLYGPVPNYTLFSGFSGACGATNDGDGVVAYDRAANRFVLSWFAGIRGGYSAYYQCIAVSKTPDPLGEWYRYAYAYSSMNDYPKIAVWSDGYYLTYNMFGGNFLGAMACVVERDKMLTGASAQQVCKQTSPAYYSMLASDIDGPTPPPAGAPNILMVPSSGTPNYLYAFKFKPDWTTPANSQFTALANVSVASFVWASGGDSVPQPGTSTLLDDMGYMLMNRLAYRNFGDHQSIVASHAALVGSITGVRWYEFRLNGSGNPVVYQQGTYAPDSVHRWMSSAAMDGSGNIAVGYSAGSGSVSAGLRATGRLAGDTLGTLTQPEVVLQAGLGSQVNLSRWGDYASMNVDPADDCTFWFTGEYLRQNGSWNWSTRVISLRLPGCADPTFGVSAAPSPVSAAPGTSTTTTISTTTSATPAASLSLSAAGLPSGVTAAFSPTSVTAGSSSTLTFTVGATAVAGSYPVTVNATNGTATATTTVTLDVAGAPGAPGVPSVRRDGWGSVWVSSTPPGSNGGSTLTGYTFTANPGGARCDADPVTAGCSVSGLTPGISYTFTASVTNGIGVGAPSSPSAAVIAVGRTTFASDASISGTRVLDLVPNTGVPVPVGARLLVYTTMDNSSSTAPTVKTVSLPSGGRASCSTGYTALSGATSTAGSGIRAGIISCAVSRAIPAAGLVRVTLSTNVAKAVATGEYLEGFANGGTVTTTSAAVNSASAPASNTTASVPAGRLVVGMIGYEDGALVLAGDADTTGGAWQPVLALRSGTSGVAGVSVMRQLKWVTAASTQRYDSATSTTANEQWAAFILTVT